MRYRQKTIRKEREGIIMVNRFVLNGISYHGAGAIQEIPGIIKSKGLKKRLWHQIPIW